jgi:hypothetical protein
MGEEYQYLFLLSRKKLRGRVPVRIQIPTQCQLRLDRRARSGLMYRM